MIQLDKCPICGSAATVDRETHALPRVVCIGCGLSTRHVFEEGLAEVWNNRSPLSDPTPLCDWCERPDKSVKPREMSPQYSLCDECWFDLCAQSAYDDEPKDREEEG